MMEQLLLTKKAHQLSLTTVLLNFDGDDGSGIFVDGSTNPKTISKVGFPTLTALNPKFGPTCGLFDPSGHIIVSDYFDNGGLGVQGDVFTIETWAATTQGAGSLGGLWNLDFDDGGAYAGILMTIGGLFMSYSGTQWDLFAVGGNAGLSDGQYHHSAVVREESSLRVYFDGNLQVDVNIGTNHPAAGNGKGRIRVGAQTSGGYAGLLDSFRVRKEAVYTGSSFMVPTAPFGQL